MKLWQTLEMKMINCEIKQNVHKVCEERVQFQLFLSSRLGNFPRQYYLSLIYLKLHSSDC